MRLLEPPTGASLGFEQRVGPWIRGAPPGLLALVSRRAGRDVLAHSLQVADVAGRLAVAFGMGARRREAVMVAGVLHDAGKCLVARSILNKAGPLDEHEWLEIKRHPAAGARLLRAYGLDEAAPWVLAHHERPDGRGYPHGLRGEDIPLEARIVAVADTYDAMTSGRSYRPRVRRVDAVDELRRAAGSQLDANVVAAFLDGAGPECPQGVRAPSSSSRWRLRSSPPV